MGAPQWTSGEILQLRALARTHTQAEAARLLGRSLCSVNGYACAPGIRFQKYGERHHSARYDAATVRAIARLRAQGLSPRQIGAALALPKSGVDAIVRYQVRVREYMGYETEIQRDA